MHAKAEVEDEEEAGVEVAEAGVEVAEAGVVVEGLTVRRRSGTWTRVDMSV